MEPLPAHCSNILHEAVVFNSVDKAYLKYNLTDSIFNQSGSEQEELTESLV